MTATSLSINHKIYVSWLWPTTETLVVNMFKISRNKNKVVSSINFDTINYIKNKIILYIIFTRHFCLLSTKPKIKRSYASHQSLRFD